VKPHTATATALTTEELQFECIPHPPYSPDLALSDFHVFGPLKDALSGTLFRDDDEVRSAVHEWLCTHPKDFFSRGIYALVKRWRKCTELGGYYVEQ
jgi:histone-lysine N-methyltransferase SETMAR